MHAALLAFLWIGVSWQNTEPVSVEAEVWDMKTQDAAPPPPPPVMDTAPPPTPEPLPAPKVIPPPPVEVKVAPKPPDIALEREKQRKLQREEERKERELAERAEEKRQDLADKKAREKTDKLAAEKKKKEQDAADKQAEKLAEKRAEELADKKDAEKKLLADKKKAADKLAKAKAAAEDKVMKDIRDADMRRITGQASGNGTSGTAPKSTAPRLDASYQAAIAGKVKRSTNFAGDTSVPGNPRAEFVVEQLPTGEIISVRKTKSSGVPAFDAAVERGINAASPLPKKKDGTVERSFPIGVAMKDLE